MWLALTATGDFPAAQEKLIAPLIATHNADFELEETKAKVDYGTKKHKWLVVHSVILHKMDCVP